MTIFISVASYCDPVLRFTLDQALGTARWPEHLHFGLVDQSGADLPSINADSLAPARLSLVRIDPLHARGPCWARALAMSLYDGEDWFFQIDSHMTFDPDWDARLIAHAQRLAAGRRGIAISSYPNPFVFDKDGTVQLRPTTSRVLAHVVKPAATFEADHLVLPFEAHPVDTDQQVPGFHVGVGCLFASGTITQCIPYDPNFYFHGEEQGLALRLFTHGWDIFHIPELPVYHLYNNAESGRRADTDRTLRTVLGDQRRVGGHQLGVGLAGLADHVGVRPHSCSNCVQPRESRPSDAQTGIGRGDVAQRHPVRGHSAVVRFEVRIGVDGERYGRLHGLLHRVVAVQVRVGRPPHDHAVRQGERVVTGALVLDESTLAVVAGANGELVETGGVEDLADQPHRCRRAVVGRTRHREVTIVEAERVDDTRRSRRGRLERLRGRPHEHVPVGVSRRPFAHQHAADVDGAGPHLMCALDHRPAGHLDTEHERTLPARPPNREGRRGSGALSCLPHVALR